MLKLPVLPQGLDAKQQANKRQPGKQWKHFQQIAWPFFLTFLWICYWYATIRFFATYCKEASGREHTNTSTTLKGKLSNHLISLWVVIIINNNVIIGNIWTVNQLFLSVSLNLKHVIEMLHVISTSSIKLGEYIDQK